jgi:hypothetical protein
MLSQLSTIKARLGLELFDTTDDAIITNIIKHVSARFAAECNRIFDYAPATDFDFQADQTALIVDRSPIEAVSAFYLKSSEDEGWIAQPGIKYLILSRRSAIELSEALGTWDQLGRVTYSGGFVLPGATPSPGQVALPDDLEQSCVEQAVYWYQRRSQLGLVSISSEAVWAWSSNSNHPISCHRCRPCSHFMSVTSTDHSREWNATGAGSRNASLLFG